MFNNDAIIRYLQNNNVLALKLDRAVAAVGQEVSSQMGYIGQGAQRLLFYASCFTDEYNDVCLQQWKEDVRFKNAVIRIIQHVDIIRDMLRIYFEEVFKRRSNEQLEHIKKMLMGLSVHIAASTLTSDGFAYAVATSVRIGFHLSVQLSKLSGRTVGMVVSGMTTYGLVQKAAGSARRLHVRYPTYYSALYQRELEMMYFLIEPVFEQARAYEAQWASDSEVAHIISRMIR